MATSNGLMNRIMNAPLSYLSSHTSRKRYRLRHELRAAVADMEGTVQKMETAASELALLAKEIAAAAEAATPKDSAAAKGLSRSPPFGYKAYKSHCDKHGYIRSTEAAQLVEEAISAVRGFIQGTHLAIMKVHQAIEMSIASALFTGVASREVQERQEEPTAEAWVSPGVDLHNTVSLGLDASQQALQAPVAPSLHFLEHATKSRVSLRTKILALDRHIKESGSRMELLYSIANSADGWVQYSRMPSSVASYSGPCSKSMADLLQEEIRDVFDCLCTTHAGIKSTGSLCHNVAAHLWFVHTSDSDSKTLETTWVWNGFEKKLHIRFLKKNELMRRLEESIRHTTKSVEKLKRRLSWFILDVETFKLLSYKRPLPAQ